MNIKYRVQRNSVFLFITLLACLALFFAFYGASKSLWLDEAYSVLIAKQSFSEMTASLKLDAHPPLYYLLLSIWIKLFGDAEVAVRSLSGVFYIGGVFVIYLLGREIYERRVGFIAAFLYALSPLATGTAHSARMYALLGFLAALSTLLFTEIFLRDNNSRLVFWACIAVNVLGAFTQIWFFFLLASQILAYLILFYPKNRLKFFALQFFSVLPFAVLWTPILLIQMKNNATAWVGRPGFAEIVAVFLGFFGERVAIVFYPSIVALLILSFKIWSPETRSKSFVSFKEYLKAEPTLTFALLFVFSIAIPFFIGQFKPIFGQTRYTIVALPAFVLIIASLLCRFVNQKQLIIFCAFLFCLVGFAFVRFYNRVEICTDRNAVARLLERAERNDTIIFTSSSRLTADYYFNRFHAAGNFDEYSFPHELEEHPGWRNVPKMLENRAALETEAENLIARLPNGANKPQKIWLFYGNDTEVNSILKNRLDADFVLQDKIDVSCAGTEGNQSDAFYMDIFLYRTSAE